MNYWWKIKIITDNKETISGFMLTNSANDPIAEAPAYTEMFHIKIRDRKSIACQPSTYTLYATKITYIQTYYLGTEPSQVGV